MARMARSSQEGNSFLAKLYANKTDVIGGKDLTFKQERTAMLRTAEEHIEASTVAAYGLVNDGTKVWNPQTTDFDRLAMKAGVELKAMLEDAIGSTGGLMLDLEEVRPLTSNVIASRYREHMVTDKALMAFAVKITDNHSKLVTAHCVVSYTNDRGKDCFNVESPIYVGEDIESAEPMELSSEVMAQLLDCKEDVDVINERPLAFFNANEDQMEVIPVEAAEVVASKLVDAGFKVAARYIDATWGVDTFGRICNEVVLAPAEYGRMATAIREAIAGMGGKADEDWFKRFEDKGKKDYPKDKAKDWANRAEEKAKLPYKDKDWVDRSDEKPEVQSEAKSAYGSDAKMMRFEMKRRAIMKRRATKSEAQRTINETKKSLGARLKRLADVLTDENTTSTS